MIDEREVRAEILRLENGPSTMSACEKLAVLYTVRNNLEAPAPEPKQSAPEPQTKHSRSAYSYSAGPNSSEFLQAMSGVELDAALDILDEHMEAIRVLYPKEYRAVCRRLEILK